MSKILQVPILSASIALFAVAHTQGAQAQSGCASQILKQIASMAGLPSTWVGLIPFALKTESTAEPPYDQITQTSPTFANRDGQSLRKEDEDLAKAQQFVRSMPLSPGNQTCVSNMQKVRDNIQKELHQRDLENVPDKYSMKQFRDLRDQRANQTANQHYDRNPMAPGGPGGQQPHTSPGNSGDSGGQSGGGAGCPGCYMNQGW